MNGPGYWWRKALVLFGREKFAGELEEEMAFHREQVAKELEEGGMTPEAARSAAMRQFGNATRMRERSHEVVGFRAETVAQDLRFAVRQLRKSPGFAVTAILMLALGIGASTAIFGFVDAALIQPLPYAQQNRLVDVDESAEAFPRSNISRDDYEDWKRMNTTLQSLDVYTGSGFLLRIGSTSEPVPGARVSDGFFHTLGVQPMLGRDFRPGEDMPGGAKIVMLSYGTWMTRGSAGGDRHCGGARVVDRRIRRDEEPAVRRARLGCIDAGRRGGGAGCVCATGELHSGKASGASESGGSVAGGVRISAGAGGRELRSGKRRS
jgi:hypothetical protein